MAAESAPKEGAMLPEINLAVPVKDSDRSYLGLPASGFFKIPQIKAKVIERYLLYRETVGDDLIKKIMVYTLLMKKTIKEKAFFLYLMDTYWFKETVDLYFNGEYERKYNEIMNTFLGRGVIKLENRDLFTTIKP
ncbi:MAG: hypothetical protein QME06_02040 [Desulfobacterales bacterium]|nr:hypothetical protein [Desulfobacterales bacterium]